MEEHYMKIPVCVRPWFHFGLGWNTFSACCASYKLDFGDIAKTTDNADAIMKVFNHKSYLHLRKKLVNGELPQPCTTCSQKNAVGSLQHLQEQELSMLMQIEDAEQRYRATNNYNNAVASIIRRDTIVDYMPVHAIVTCGSACNIKCKFCYNCNMNYNPNPDDLLRIIDNIHENLVFCQLTGGEPLITKAGRALLQRFAEGKYKFAVRLGTNAQWTDFDLLKPVNLADVQISTDGATKEVYELVRVGGDFDDLISNIKKFMDMKKEKPFLKVTTNFTVTSDNYMDIPAACKLYEDLGTFTMFGFVMREKEDPQNIVERADLYEPFLKKIDEALAVVQSPFTKDKLVAMQNVILSKMKKQVNGVKTSLMNEPNCLC